MSKPEATPPTAQVISFPRRNFHGAAIIEDDGTETAITEAMVDEAIDRLVNYLPNWLHPLSAPMNS